MLCCVASAVVSIYLLSRFDTLVHGQLYDYGLRFDPAWADAYYSYSQLMYIALGAPIALCFVAILIGFKTIKEQSPPKPTLKPKLAQPQPVARPQPRTVVRPQTPAVTRQGHKTPEVKAQIKEKPNFAGVTCPSCKKVFGRPLVMLNFENGKNRLVNVCPYCSYELGPAENKQEHKSRFNIRGSK
jgi:hypothetical protein